MGLEHNGCLPSSSRREESLREEFGMLERLDISQEDVRNSLIFVLRISGTLCHGQPCPVASSEPTLINLEAICV